MRRDSRLVTEPATGREVSVWDGEPSLLESPEDVPLVDTTAPRGDSGIRGSIAELAPPPVGAEFSPEILAEIPDGTEFLFDDPEVYGNDMPVRTGSMHVPDIQLVEWSKLSPAHKFVKQDLYLQRCEQRRKDTIK